MEESLSAAVSRRRDSVATPLVCSVGGGYVESVVTDCGDGPTHREGRPRSSSNHLTNSLYGHH